jgi:hypothetical protein
MRRNSPIGAAYADRSPSERQQYLKTLVVEYRGLNDVLRKIGEWHMPVKGGVHATGSCHVLLGEHRAGKSFALAQYRSRFPSRLDEQAEARVTPVLYVETAAQSNARDLAIALYDALSNGPVAADSRLGGQTLLNKFLMELPFHGVELIIFDDAQNLIVDNHDRNNKLFKDFICRVLNRNCCGVIMAGKSSVYDAVESYAPLEGRGSLPNFTLPALRWSVADERKEFIHFCKELDRRLPFREPSLLGDPKVALHLFYASRGLIGRLCNYVRDAAHMAINENADSIRIEHLREAAMDRLRPGSDFVPFDQQITPTMVEQVEAT